METNILDNVLAQMRNALKQKEIQHAVAILQSLRLPDQAELLGELNNDEQVRLLPRLSPAESADILEEMDEEDAAELAAALPATAVISIVEEMAPDEAADLLGDMDPIQAEAILAGLENPEEVRPLLLHSDDSAGGLMTSEFLVLRQQMTAAEALHTIHNWKPGAEMIYYLFVVDQHGRLCGVVNLRQLIVAEPETLIMNIMDTEVISVPTGTDQEECARLMTRYDLLALPVVDENNRLLGVITFDDITDVLEDEATEDIQRLGGAQPLDRAYLSTGVFTIARKRIGWLMLLFITESLTGSVLRFFEDELQAVVALSFFIPLLIGTGGNAGSQTTSTIIRALAVGDIDKKDVARTFWHEIRTGALLGVVMGIVAFVRARIWGSPNTLAITVSIAILTIVIWANALGAILPLLAAKLRIDPTVVSGPAMSTLVDATGLFIYFQVARMILKL